MRTRSARWLGTIWFAADMVVALLPPLYWAASGPTPAVLGVPLVMAYFLWVAVFIFASVVVAFWIERRTGDSV
jgi:hypothetical protein